MSSGWNGIGIKSVGRTRRKLAEMLSAKTGWLVEAEKICRTNPTNQHWEDCCAWDTWADIPAHDTPHGRMPPSKGHIYSWDSMGEIVKRGVAIVSREAFDIEVCAGEDK